MAAELIRKALIESEKYEMQRSYGVKHPGEYDFKNRQEAYYVELLCRMYDLLRNREDDIKHKEQYEQELLKVAKGLLVFSDPSTENEFSHINKQNNTLFVATIYYICGYEAIASLLLKRMGNVYYETKAAQQLYSLVRGKEYPDGEEKLGVSVALRFLLSEQHHELAEYEHELKEKRNLFNYSSEREFFDEQMMMFALNRFMENNLASDLYLFDPKTDWEQYIKYSANEGILTFLPSQRDALEKGLLNFEGSFSLKMPTSAGKSYITELLIYQELTNNLDSKVLYLAPLRSLSRELGEKFEKIKRFFGYKVSVKYGGASATGNELSDDIQILVSTPEYFISLEEGIEDLLEQYKLIICDEGQLLDDYSRGINYEMLLTRLRKIDDKRFLFISAIIPNIQDVNEWLGGTDSLIGDSTYRPSTIILSKIVENGNDLNLIVYDQDNKSELFRIEKFANSQDFSFGTSRNMDLACAASLQAVNAGSVMLYVSYKRGNRGCEAFSSSINDLLDRNNQAVKLPSRDERKRLNLLQYVDYQCGPKYLLSHCLAKGFAYHHADIPQDIRELIEESIDDGVIQLVVCTSTLAEGVNLPLKTIVLGNINDPMYASQGWYLNRATLKNILGRVGRAGRERYGLVIFPDNKKKNPFSIVQDALNDRYIPKVQGTLFRLVNYLVSTEKVKNINDLNELLGDNDLVAAIDLMITKSTGAQSLEELSIDELIRDSLAYKLGNEQQQEMLKNVFQARYQRLKEQFDANEYALLKSTGLTVRDLNKCHEIMGESDAQLFNDASYYQWSDFVGYILDKLYLLPTVQEAIEDDSHKYVKDYISNVDLMKKICTYWMKGENYHEIALKLITEEQNVDQVIVSIIFMQNSICRLLKPLVSYMKIKYGVENVYLDTFHELMSVGILTEEQIYLYHHGLKNRICLHAIMNYLNEVGIRMTENEYIRPYLKHHMDVLKEYLLGVGYPYLAFEKIEKWAIRN